ISSKNASALRRQRSHTSMPRPPYSAKRVFFGLRHRCFIDAQIPYSARLRKPCFSATVFPSRNLLDMGKSLFLRAILTLGAMLCLSACASVPKVAGSCPALPPPPAAAVDALQSANDSAVDAWAVALDRHYDKLDACRGR